MLVAAFFRRARPSRGRYFRLKLCLYYAPASISQERVLYTALAVRYFFSKIWQKYF